MSNFRFLYIPGAEEECPLADNEMPMEVTIHSPVLAPAPSQSCPQSLGLDPIIASELLAENDSRFDSSRVIVTTAWTEIEMTVSVQRQESGK